jgi:SAM-dependent methyltransferase
VNEKSAFDRYDSSPDALFYQQPRFVEHIDDVAIADVVRIHRERLPAGGEILDLMSSWVSHLPDDVTYKRVAGLGMSAVELVRNPRLNEHVVHDLNANAVLQYPDATFDAATICVSIQYLIDPFSVLRDLGRVVRAGGPCVVTFSNRCFPTKAVAIWQALNDDGHVKLVSHYFTTAGWTGIEALRSPKRPEDPLYAVIAASPGAIPSSP